MDSNREGVTSGPLGGNPKLNRGDEHLEALNESFLSWKAQDPVRTVGTRSDDFMVYDLFVDFVVPPPIVEWALRAGDVLSCYRAALDHLVYAMAVGESGDPPPKAEFIAFPITDSVDAFDGFLWKLEGLSGDTVDRLRDLQPNTVDPHPLRSLRDLSNGDKHRLPNLAVLRAARIDPVVSGVPDGVGYEVTVCEGLLAVGKPVLSIRLDRPCQSVEVEVDLKLRVGFLRSTDDGLSLFDALNDIREAVIPIVNELDVGPITRPGGADQETGRERS